MNIKTSIKYYIWLFFLFLFSCCKESPKELKQLPIEKLYIVESGFFEKQTSTFFMDLFGYCELDKNFNMEIAAKSDDGNFYISKMVIPDSLRQIILETIKNYKIDTAYELLIEYPVVDMRNSNHIYFFIMKKEDGEKITIRFKPNALPEDLRSIYKYLYYNPRETVGKDIFFNNIDSLHQIFDKEILNNMYTIPSSIKFIVPNIIKY